MGFFVIGNPYIIKLIINPFIFLKGLALYTITLRPRRYYAAPKLAKPSSLRGRIRTPGSVRPLHDANTKK